MKGLYYATTVVRTVPPSLRFGEAPEREARRRQVVLVVMLIASGVIGGAALYTARRDF